VHTQIAFIVPSIPVVKGTPPIGREWIHEIKFDGRYVQFHKRDADVTMFTGSGKDFTHRFPFIRDSVLNLPADSVVIDAELVSCDMEGRPNVNALVRGQNENLCAWCFDLLALDGVDLRHLPLAERKAHLRVLLIEAEDYVLRYSDEFPTPVYLLQNAGKWGFEGIVSKRADQPYVGGRNPGWVMVKCKTWQKASRSRGENKRA
jgi:bifunctional non-homologous end joining protein LigD